MKKNKEQQFFHTINGILMICLTLLSVAAAIRYASLQETWSTAGMVMIHLLLILLDLSAWMSGIPALFLPVGIACIVLNSTATFSTVHTFYQLFLPQAILALAGGVLLTGFQIVKKIRPRKIPVVPAAAFVLLLAGSLLFWGFNFRTTRSADGPAEIQIWGVPAKYDKEECKEAGTLSEFTFKSKAYATDNRTVRRTVLVYTPYGYDQNKQYDILYLLHGTGDNQYSWLQENPANKRLLDHMIAEGEVNPLIVVTPTFYVENDCEDDLDQLTYSFEKELKNDLIPAVETAFSTYAEGVEPENLIASRDHRAFAGLSRGAVTMYHSALCGSLDYFSWFGGFSGSRTSAEYFMKTIQSADFADYPINYLYVTSGNMDFALPGQLEEYRDLLEIEPRLSAGVNTSMDVFPMRYHSWGNWHIALYNFLQHIF